MDEKLIGILAAALGATETEVTETLKSDDGSEQLQSQLKAKLKARFDDGVKASDKKLKGKVEAAFKAKGVEIASFDDLETGLDELASKAPQASADGKLTDDQVLQHPAVKKLRNDLTLQQEQAVQKAKEETQTALQSQIEDFNRKQTQTSVRQKAEQILAELKPVFDADPTRAAKQKQRLLEDIVNGSYQVEEDGTVRLLDKDGELRKDDMGNTIKFNDYVKQVTTDYYPLPAATERQNAGLTPEQIAAAGRADAYTGPKTEQDYANALNAENDPAKRIALSTAYKAFKEKSTAE